MLLIEWPASSIPLTSFVILVLVALISWATKPSTVPSDVPWVGRRATRFFPQTRAALTCFFRVKQIFEEGYCKYSRNGKTYIYPSYSGPPEVILPRSDLPWLLDQPESVVSSDALQIDLMEGQYAFTDPKLLQSPFHSHILVRYLTRRVGCLLPDIWDELRHAVSTSWGSDSSEWREICVWENMMGCIASTSNRMLVGKPLCRNQGYLNSAGSFANDVMLSITTLSFCPSIFKPIFGRLVTLPNHHHYRQTAKHTLPIITERLRNMRRKQSDPTFDWKEPNDYITWHIQHAMSEGLADELDPVRISRRLLPINFAAIYTTTLTITNVLFDIFSGPDAAGTVARLREEAERVYTACDGRWSKAHVAQLVRIDSALRESMRLNGFLTRSILRKVVSPHGLTHPREGWTLPQGAWVAVDVMSTHHDEDIYPAAARYDPFRFSRPREDAARGAGSGSGVGAAAAAADGDRRQQKSQVVDRGETLALKNMGMVSTSETWLGFGHGRHACPGRFFVAHELKMLICFVLLHYDVEPLAERPRNSMFGTNVLCDMKATIRVKRKTARAACV